MRRIGLCTKTIRTFKLSSLEDRLEDFGQEATYLGTIGGQESVFVLDEDHVFVPGRPVHVSGTSSPKLIPSPSPLVDPSPVHFVLSCSAVSFSSSCYLAYIIAHLSSCIACCCHYAMEHLCTLPCTSLPLPFLFSTCSPLSSCTCCWFFL